MCQYHLATSLKASAVPTIATRCHSVVSLSVCSSVHLSWIACGLTAMPVWPHVILTCIRQQHHLHYCFHRKQIWGLKHFTDLHRRTSPICVNQWDLLAADRDCNLLLAATSSSAQLSRTLVPGHSLQQDPKPGITFRQTFVRLTLSSLMKVL